MSPLTLSFTPDTRKLPALGLATTVVVIASIVFAYFTHRSLEAAQSRQATLLSHLIELGRQHDAAQIKEADSQLANQEYTQLNRAGLVTPRTRLQLAESLETLIGKAHSGNLRYTLTAYSGNIHESPNDNSPIHVTGTLEHETAFLTLLSQLATPTVGGFRPINCTLTPTSDKHAKEIQIDCQLIRPALIQAE